MRIEPYSIDSIVHITKRGTRGMDIVRDDNDRERFVKSIFLLNDAYSDPYWHRESSKLPLFTRPLHWPERKPLVHVLAWTLLSNHFHMLLQEIQEGGTAKFMQRLGGSMSMCFNLKYKERGSIFEGAYRARIVDRDAHFNYLAFYILVKNVLDMYPGGLRAGCANFDDAWEWASHYPFSSLSNVISGIPTPTIEDIEGLIPGVIGIGNSFKEEAKGLLEMHNSSHDNFREVMLESW